MRLGKIVAVVGAGLMSLDWDWQGTGERGGGEEKVVQ